MVGYFYRCQTNSLRYFRNHLLTPIITATAPNGGGLVWPTEIFCFHSAKCQQSKNIDIGFLQLKARKRKDNHVDFDICGTTNCRSVTPYPSFSFSHFFRDLQFLRDEVVSKSTSSLQHFQYVYKKIL